MKFDKWPRGGCGIYENNACLMFLSRFSHEPSHKCQNRIHLLTGNPVVPPLLPPSPLSSRSTTLGEANASPPKPTSSQHAARVRPSKSTPNSLANSATDRAVPRPLPGPRSCIRTTSNESSLLCLALSSPTMGASASSSSRCPQPPPPRPSSRTGGRAPDRGLIQRHR